MPQKISECKKGNQKALLPTLGFSIFQVGKVPNILILNRLRIPDVFSVSRGAAAPGFTDLLLSLPASSILKREKRLRTKNVHFSCVTVYYFTRRQGFTSVPSQGGSTLGMSSRHNSVRQYTLGEFAREQERLHREMLREHLREEKLNSLKLKVKPESSFCKISYSHSIWANHFYSWARLCFACRTLVFFFYF